MLGHMPRRALLLINRSKPEVCAALEGVSAVIRSAGGAIVGERPALADGPAAPDETSGVDVLVVLGGDGTILSQARRFAAAGLPLLGINFGKLGFLAEFDLESFQRHAAQVFGSAPLDLIERRMMHIAVRRAGAAAGTFIGLALNDAVVSAGEPFRMIEAHLSIDGQPGPTAAGDGVVVSTPVGSTAYNASAGGPILAPDVDALVISPIAAQSLSFRPVVVRSSATVTLTMARVNTGSATSTFAAQQARAADDAPRGRATVAPNEPLIEAVGGTALVLDGRIACRLSRGDQVIIRSHDRPVRFVRNPDQNYWDTLIQKMHWAARPRLRGE
ncbi:NAD kinase [soil metagenome]